MKKRVCENCRFFQEAGVAKSGWCNNPLRKESSDVKLVVRRNELACRNGWAQDLFRARTDESEAADIVLHDTVSLRPLPPVSPEEMSFLVNSQRDKPSEAEPPPVLPAVDVVVGEAPSTKPASERVSLLTHDPRSAILKARERYRARMSAELRRGEGGRAADDRPVDTSGSLAPVPPVRSSAPTAPLPSMRQPRAAEVPPVRLSEVPRDFPTMTSFPEDEARFSSIPEPVEGIVLPRAAANTSERIETAASGFGDDLVEDEIELSSATTTASDPPAVPSRRRGGDTDLRRRPQRDVAPVERDAVDKMPPQEADAGDLVRAERPERRRFDFGRRRREDRRVVAAEFEQIDPEPPGMEERWPGEATVRPAIDEFVDDVNPIIEIAPSVPRMCKTCRDFRPADSGERGWCTNKWAFSHRRMVDADELPCETSVGCWWLPHDDVWLATADVSAHGQPTPLVDHWLAHKVGSTTADTGDRRRRQRS